MSARVGPSAAPTNAIERHVTEAHRFALGHHFAEPADDGDHAGAGTRADQCIVRRGEQPVSPWKNAMTAVSSANTSPNNVNPSGMR